MKFCPLNILGSITFLNTLSTKFNSRLNLVILVLAMLLNLEHANTWLIPCQINKITQVSMCVLFCLAQNHYI